MVLKGFVHLKHGAADRRDEVGGGLDALDGAKLFAGFEHIIHFGHINIHHIAQLLLGVIGNTNVAGRAVYFYKLVRL